MDITKGHIVFALIFAVVFLVIIAWMYRKDLKLHRIYYKGSWMVLVAVVIGIAVFLFLKSRLIHF
jgi:hypothetical protein